MADRKREREDKYDVGPDFALPDLRDLVPTHGRLDQAVVRLDSRYFDTPERDLLGSRVTLRRRSGDVDAGWQLKVPEGKARTEIRLPPEADDAVPQELLTLLRGVARRRPLLEVARVRTERTLHRMQAADGSTLVEVADDDVHGTARGDGALLTRWREIEVELHAGDEADLKRLRRRLVRAGARPSPSSSKLARALDIEPSHEPPAETCAAVVTGYLRQQYAELVAGDVSLRQGRDVIHSTRVAARRVRSTLRTFHELFDEAKARDLDAELAWYAGLLGEIRDRQVQRGRFAAAIDALPAELVLGSVAADTDNWLRAEQDDSGRELQTAMDGERYLRLLGDMRDWADTPPFTDVADAGTAALKRSVGRARRKADKRVHRALAAARTGGDIGVALHSARKATKRARYAIELSAPTGRPKRAKKIIKRYKELQDILGQHQDSITAASLLRDHTANTKTPSGTAFTHGLLHAREQTTAQKARKHAAKQAHA